MDELDAPPARRAARARCAAAGRRRGRGRASSAMWVWPSMSPGITRSPLRVDDASAPATRRDRVARADRDDRAVADRQRALGQHRPRRVHRHDDAADDEQVEPLPGVPCRRLPSSPAPVAALTRRSRPRRPRTWARHAGIRHREAQRGGLTAGTRRTNSVAVCEPGGSRT